MAGCFKKIRNSDLCYTSSLNPDEQNESIMDTSAEYYSCDNSFTSHNLSNADYYSSNENSFVSSNPNFPNAVYYSSKNLFKVHHFPNVEYGGSNENSSTSHNFHNAAFYSSKNLFEVHDFSNAEYSSSNKNLSTSHNFPNAEYYSSNENSFVSPTVPSAVYYSSKNLFEVQHFPNAEYSSSNENSSNSRFFHNSAFYSSKNSFNVHNFPYAGYSSSSDHTSTNWSFPNADCYSKENSFTSPKFADDIYSDNIDSSELKHSNKFLELHPSRGRKPKDKDLFRFKSYKDEADYKKLRTFLRDYEFVGDSHSLRMGNVLHQRPYTTRREGLAISGCTTNQLLMEIKSKPPKGPVLLVIGCNDLIQTLQTPLRQRKHEFDSRKQSLFSLLKLMIQCPVCIVLEVFRIPKMDRLYGRVSTFYLQIWNNIINQFDGFGGIKVVKSEHLLCTATKHTRMSLYERFIGPNRDTDMIHLNKYGYKIILDELRLVISSAANSKKKSIAESPEEDLEVTLKNLDDSSIDSESEETCFEGCRVLPAAQWDDWQYKYGFSIW